MKNTFGVKLIYQFYHSSVKAELKRRGFSKDVAKKIAKEHEQIVERAKDIGNSKLLSSYIIGITWIPYIDYRQPLYLLYNPQCRNRARTTRPPYNAKI